ncbi:unnamed protein product, partial [Ectocarpus sp. 12 AP-2014]
MSPRASNLRSRLPARAGIGAAAAGVARERDTRDATMQDAGESDGGGGEKTTRPSEDPTVELRKSCDYCVRLKRACDGKNPC